MIVLLQALLEPGNEELSEMYLSNRSGQSSSTFLTGKSGGLGLDSLPNLRGAQVLCALSPL